MNFDAYDFTMKDGRTAHIRPVTGDDAAALLEHLRVTSAETPFMARYPDEIRLTEAEEADFLAQRFAAPRDGMAGAWVNGQLAGCASFSCQYAGMDKYAHCAGFGLSLKRPYWHGGLGTELVERCIALARQAGYTQMILDAVEENTRAIAVYERIGFERYGRLPRGFVFRDGTDAAMILMVRAL